jgi:hypothetical protein
VSATLSENGRARARVSPPPPDVTSGVRPLGGVGLHVSASPPDVVAGAHALAAALGAGLRLSAPPPDVLSGARPLAPAAASLGWSDEIGAAATAVESPPPAAAQVLDNQTIYRIVREVAVPLSGDELYSAVAADEQLGLLFGLVLFPQASVHLGSVLRLMSGRAEAAFLDVFGAAAQELLAVTGAATATERLAPVHGQLLWHEPWPSRFRRAGEVPAFQAAQNEEAIERQFRPMLRPALALGLSTERALAIAYDAVATRGVGGGIRWLVETAGPLRTDRQRAAALRSLGFADVAAFQRSVGWVPADGVFGPETHAALVGALRSQGDVPVPTAAELVATLVAAAGGEAHERLERLEESQLLTDAPVSA